MSKISNENFVICINEGKAKKFLQLIKEKHFILNCSFISEEEIKDIQSTQESINTQRNEDNIFIPIIEIKKTEKIVKTEITEEICTPEEFFNKNCGNEENGEEISIEKKDNMINNIMNDIINGNLDNILDSITSGEKEDYIIQQDDILYQLTTTENQVSNEYNNISTINLGKCEYILKEKYNISNASSLIILKVDYFMENFKIPLIGYEVFHPESKIKLNLSYCENVTIDYNIPVDIDEDDLDKYNVSSDYYNDECSVYTTDDGTDIIILDRKKEFNDNNMFLCENNCNYTNYNTTTKKSVCICGVKSKIYSISEILENKESISQNFNINDTSTSSSNLSLMKCIDTLFSKYGLLKNLEFYILIIMTVIFAISGILYYRIGSNLIESDIQEILDEKYKNDKKNKHNKISKHKSNESINKSKNNISNPKKKKSKRFISKKSSTNIINKDIKLEQQKSLSKLKMNSIIDFTKEIKSHPKNFTDYELNTLSYKEALIYDKRDLMQYYISLIKTKHPIIFSFIPMSDYNSIIIKSNLFILNFAICSSINALFFTESTIHRIYFDKGKYKLGYYLPKIIISFLITHVISVGLKYLFLSQFGIIEIKKKSKYNEASDEADSVKRCLMIKYILCSRYCFPHYILVLFIIFLCCVSKYSNIFNYKYFHKFINFNFISFYY